MDSHSLAAGRCTSLRFLPVALLACAPLFTGCGGSETSSEEASGGGQRTQNPASSANQNPGAREKPTAAELYEAGLKRSRFGDIPGALKLYRRALAEDPDLAAAHFSLGTGLVPTASSAALGSSTLDHGVLDRAISHLTKAQKLEPDNAQFAYWTGRALDLRGKEAEAETMLERAVELDPTHGRAHKRLGMVRNETGDVEGARAAWLQALEFMPTDGGVRFLLGNLTIEEDPAKALEFYESAVEVAPTFPKGYYGMSQALAQLGDLEGAQAAREKLMRFQSHFDELKVLRRRAIENPDDVEALFAAGEQAYLLKDNEAAFEMFVRVLQLDPGHVPTHFYCGQIQSQEGNVDIAVQHFEECVFLDENMLAAKFALLRVCHGIDDDVRVAELKSELEIQVTEARDHALFGEVLFETGDESAAREHLAQALELDAEGSGAQAVLDRMNAKE